MRINRFEKYLFLLVPNVLLRRLITLVPKYRFFKETQGTQTAITFDLWYNQKVKGHCRNAYWPVHSTSTVQGWKNVICGVETSPGYSPGNFISSINGKIKIGDYTQIAPNVGIISDNHQLTDNRKFISKDISIGKYCWVGMGAIILPGVVLGDYTIVAAGSIVTKSFPKGFCVIGGNPAQKIKDIKKSECVFHKSDIEYVGYMRKERFDAFKKELF